MDQKRVAQIRTARQFMIERTMGEEDSPAGAAIDDLLAYIDELEAMPRTTGSARVMRSYDYCHFEITLGSDELLTLDQVNGLRKQAALLADEAVRQYKLAKKAESEREHREYKIRALLDRIKEIESKPESEWTPEEAAIMRSKDDAEFWSAYDDECYYYNDDPERDHHFSMLRRYQDVRVSAAGAGGARCIGG